MLHTILSGVAIALAVLLGGSILLQARGAGLGATFGGDSNVYRTKRGLEKILFRATILLAILFFAVVFARAILP